jgi:hypothetical protein
MRYTSYVKLFTIFFLTAFAFTGCQQKHAELTSVKDRIIGLWQFNSYREVTTLNGAVNNDQTQPVAGTVEFTNDGRVISRDEAGNTEEGTWSLVDGGKRVRIMFSDLASAGLDFAAFLKAGTFELREIQPGNLALSNLSSLSAGGKSMKYELTFHLEK